MPRFYCASPFTPGEFFSLPANIAHHVNVLRLAPDDSIMLFNGEGGEYQARLVSVEKKRAEAEILSFSPREAELPYAVTIAQALPEASKMDWIIEKTVELGAAAIQPLHSQRCVVRLSGERAEKRQVHWQRVIISAAEQCGRNRLAQLEQLADFNRWLAQPATQPRILFSPRTDQSLSGWAQSRDPQALTLMIGPEGGFTEQEEQLAVAHGALPLSLGPRILRTETAGMAAMAMLQGIWGV